jgi:hypothetical protein
VLIAIGRTCGAHVALAVYLALKQEPLDRAGERVDWLLIERAILRA